MPGDDALGRRVQQPPKAEFGTRQADGRRGHGQGLPPRPPARAVRATTPASGPVAHRVTIRRRRDLPSLPPNATADRRASPPLWHARSRTPSAPPTATSRRGTDRPGATPSNTVPEISGASWTWGDGDLAEPFCGIACAPARERSARSAPVRRWRHVDAANGSEAGGGESNDGTKRLPARRTCGYADCPRKLGGRPSTSVEPRSVPDFVDPVGRAHLSCWALTA